MVSLEHVGVPHALVDVAIGEDHLAVAVHVAVLEFAD
jgi:hypothetical protein